MSSRRQRRRQSIPTAAEDRISALPDSLICDILSFLPTKLAAATSILSKRWRPLWLSVPTLDFDDESFQDFGTFRHFVYSVILSRDVMLPLRSFSIRCGESNNFDPRDLDLFVLAAVQRRIQIFHLDVSNSELYSLKETVPCVLRILTCKTLVVLKLSNLTMYEVPNLIDFPLLKTLHLDSIYFESNFVHFMNLVRGCPILEDLETNYIDLPYQCHALEGQFKGFPKLLRANLSNLEETFPLAWLHNAKFLYAHMRWTDYNYYQVPTFHNLTHLELLYGSSYSYIYYSRPGKWKWVKQVLHHCPKLQNLIIVEEFRCSDSYVRGTEDEGWKDPETVPECLSSHLRTCSLRGCKGSKTELQFAEYVMLNSKLLCTMTIKSYYKLERNAKQRLVKLSSSPTVTCKLLFK